VTAFLHPYITSQAHQGVIVCFGDKDFGKTAQHLFLGVTCVFELDWFGSEERNPSIFCGI